MKVRLRQLRRPLKLLGERDRETLLGELAHLTLYFLKDPRRLEEALSQAFSEAIGFDFDAGRRDESTHPFCGGSNPDDVRWTTRYDEKEPYGAIFGTMHETGHALYEQGRPRDLDFQPVEERLKILDEGLHVHVTGSCHLLQSFRPRFGGPKTQHVAESFGPYIYIYI